jgi:hypothetical protein
MEKGYFTLGPNVHRRKDLQPRLCLLVHLPHMCEHVMPKHSVAHQHNSRASPLMKICDSFANRGNSLDDHRSGEDNFALLHMISQIGEQSN